MDDAQDRSAQLVFFNYASVYWTREWVFVLKVIHPKDALIKQDAKITTHVKRLGWTRRCNRELNNGLLVAKLAS